MDFIGYFDGACEPVNPGGTMAFGVVVLEGPQGVDPPHSGARLVWQSSGIAIDPPTGPTTNNLAEYTALVQLLGYFLDEKLADREIEVRGDSQLVINQMWGTWSISDDKPYANRARDAQAMLGHFTQIRGIWIPRDRNVLADTLTRAELHQAGIPVTERRKLA
jgi:ribonuclease HI